MIQPIHTITPKQTSPGQVLEVDFQIDSKTYNIFFRSNQDVLSPNLEAYIGLALLPAMVKGGGKLIVDGPVSQQLVSNLEIIQNVFSSWNQSFRHLELEGEIPVQRQIAPTGKVGIFFSGGVDSFYSLINNQKDITDLIYVHSLGFTVPEISGYQNMTASIREVAAHFGKNLIEIETNLRDMLDPNISYPDWGWNIALVVIGNLLYPYLQRLYYAQGFEYDNIVPCIDLLYPLWFRDKFEFITYGQPATRNEKIAAISNYDIVLNNLHVCHRTPGASLNCGRCEKCLRTMIALEVNHALDRCTTFGRALDLNFVKYYPIEQNRYPYYQKSLDALEESGENPALQAALRMLINRPQWQTNLIRQALKLRRRLTNRL